MKAGKHFAARLADLRQQAGLSQYELARRTGLSRESVSKLEMGDREPGWETVQLISRVLGVACTDFIDPSIEPPIVPPQRTPGRPAKPATAAQGERSEDKPTSG